MWECQAWRKTIDFRMYHLVWQPTEWKRLSLSTPIPMVSWCYPRIETLVVGSHLGSPQGFYVSCYVVLKTCDQASEYLQASANHPEFTASPRNSRGYGWKRRWRMNRPTWRITWRIMFTWFWGVCHFEQLVPKGWGWKLRSYETCRR